MAITLVASWGGSGDNCYVSLTDATSFVSNTIIDDDAWTVATTDTRAKALILATYDINAYNYDGQRLYYDQILEFPRIPPGEEPFPWGQVISATSTWNIYQAEMKRTVEQACCYQALFILKYSGKRTIHQEFKSQGIYSVSKSAGGVSESYSYRDGINRLCPEASSLLAAYRVGPRILRG